MKAQKTCPTCGAISYKTEIIEETIKFRDNNNVICEATATRENDAFYEITKGKHRGNLVHIWNLIK